MNKFRNALTALFAALLLISSHCEAQCTSTGCAEASVGCDGSSLSCDDRRCFDRLWENLRCKGHCHPLFLRASTCTVLFGESADIRIAGTTLPGGGISVEDHTTFAFDLGYRIAPRWSVMLTSGAPPETTINGAGALAGATIGEVTYAPIMLTTQYYVPLGRRITALEDSYVYVGAGVNYTMFYETLDGNVSDFDIDDAAGTLLQLGVQKNFNNSLGAFAEVKRLFLETDATGNLGLAPIDADLKLNATILKFGMSYGF